MGNALRIKINSNMDGMGDIDLCGDSQLRKEIINKYELINNIL